MSKERKIAQFTKEKTPLFPQFNKVFLLVFCQFGVSLFMRVDPPNYGPFDLDHPRNIYVVRNRLLADLGFSDYSQYRSSKLWKGIRLRVFKRDKSLCRLCKRKAKVVHHITYTKKNLTGQNLAYMISLCNRCHCRCEFSQSRKITKNSELFDKFNKLAAHVSESRMPKLHIRKRFINYQSVGAYDLNDFFIYLKGIFPGFIREKNVFTNRFTNLTIKYIPKPGFINLTIMHDLMKIDFNINSLDKNRQEIDYSQLTDLLKFLLDGDTAL